jgi:hypothetical protein
MCQHFDPLRNKCNIYNEAVEAKETERAIQCQEEGLFVRDLNVLPDYFNIYENIEDAPSGWKPDFSKLPKDSKGRELYVVTNRGYERALPAYDEIEIEASFFNKVPRWITYQGQREMVYQYGYELAKQIIEEKGYKLNALPGEESYKGFETYKRYYRHNKPQDKKLVMMSEEPIEVWD